MVISHSSGLENNMARILICALGVILLASVQAHASLIGDVVTVRHYFPTNLSVHDDMGPVTVAAGTSDSVTYFSGVYTVNVEASSVLVDFNASASWTSASFNGLIVGDLDFSPLASVTGLTIDTNIAGWTNSRATFTGDSVSFNWNGLSVNSSSYFNAVIETDAIDAVPEPATMVIWSCLCGLGFVCTRHGSIKRRSAQIQPLGV